MTSSYRRWPTEIDIDRDGIYRRQRVSDDTMALMDHSVYQLQERGIMSNEYNDSLEVHTQSKVEDAFMVMRERLVNIGIAITALEDRLVPVMNDYPRPAKDDSMTDPKNHNAPSGDSLLLTKINDLSEDLRVKEEFVRILIDRLDI